jgi:hypothetical protein
MRKKYASLKKVTNYHDDYSSNEHQNGYSINAMHQFQVNIRRRTLRIFPENPENIKVIEKLLPNHDTSC